MNKTCIVIAMLSLSVSAYSQNECNPLQYAMPQFSRGLITLDDGSRQSGIFNVCIVDQGVYMISGRDTVITEANDRIIQVSAGNKLFLKFQDEFMEVIDMAGHVLLCQIRSTTIVDNVKAGAYGSVSATASIETVAVDYSHNVLLKNVIDDPANVRYQETFVLAVDNRRYPFTKKNLTKCFPKKKEFIEQYFTERKVNLTDRGEVLELFLELK